MPDKSSLPKMKKQQKFAASAAAETHKTNNALGFCIQHVPTDLRFSARQLPLFIVVAPPPKKTPAKKLFAKQNATGPCSVASEILLFYFA